MCSPLTVYRSHSREIPLCAQCAYVVETTRTLGFGIWDLDLKNLFNDDLYHHLIGKVFIDGGHQLFFAQQ